MARSPFGSIFFKEYLKTRRPWISLLLLNIGLMIYIHIEFRHLFTLDHPEVVWYRTMHIGQIHFNVLRYAPVITGLLFACLQFLPEMTAERLRLSLHLPVHPRRLILAHILSGLVAVGLIIGLDLAALALIASRFFPAEGVSMVLITALPWALAGITTYLGVTLALLEPDYKRKMFNLVLAAGVTALYLHHIKPYGYAPSLLLLGLLIPLMIPIIWLPVWHYRFRRVS
ncbi:MAG: hypothetical protein CSB33_01000 [Desulfobacterales bacterium]|nr:MAG: hypothetical protein CSB33_01000 [Desulfobacterales bacterium]